MQQPEPPVQHFITIDVGLLYDHQLLTRLLVSKKHLTVVTTINWNLPVHTLFQSHCRVRTPLSKLAVTFSPVVVMELCDFQLHGNGSIWDKKAINKQGVQYLPRLFSIHHSFLFPPIPFLNFITHCVFSFFLSQFVFHLTINGYCDSRWQPIDCRF